MKKLLCLCLACLMLLTLGLPCACAASPDSYRDWTNVVQILVLDSDDDYGLIGLRSNGTVLFDGPQDSEYAAAQDWTGVSRLELSGIGLLGYRADGTVLTTSSCDLSAWTNIRKVFYSWQSLTVFGLRYDGTIVAAPGPYRTQEELDADLAIWDLDSWSNVVAIYGAIGAELIGLRSDGTLCFLIGTNSDTYTGWTGPQSLAYYAWGEPENWTNIASFPSFSSDIPYALRSDGCVFGPGEWVEDHLVPLPPEEWHDITALYFTGGFDNAGLCIGLRGDGTVAIFDPERPERSDTQPDLEQIRSWTDIVQLAVGYYCLPVGLKADGTAAYVSVDREGKPNGLDLSEWTELKAVYRSMNAVFGLRVDGTVLFACEDKDRAWVNEAYGVLDGWTNIDELIVLPGVWGNRVVGLRADGTVVATPFT